MTKSIAQKFSRQAEHVADEVVHDINKARKDVAARVEQTVETISEIVGEASDRTQALADTAVRTVRERPMVSVAVAAAVATLFGFFIGRVAPRKA